MDEPRAAGVGSDVPPSGESLRRVAMREPDALDAFFASYFNRVYRYVVRLLGDPVLGDDLTQESFLRMHRAIDRLDPQRDPTPWVFTIVTNTVRDYWRSKHHKSKSREVDLEHASWLIADDHGTDPGRALEQKEATQAIHAALGTLSENDRMVILLREYEQLNSTEIASMLGASPEAIRQRYSRALARLAEAYKKMLDKERRDER